MIEGLTLPCVVFRGKDVAAGQDFRVVMTETQFVFEYLMERFDALGHSSRIWVMFEEIDRNTLDKADAGFESLNKLNAWVNDREITRMSNWFSTIIICEAQLAIGPAEPQNAQDGSLDLGRCIAWQQVCRLNYEYSRYLAKVEQAFAEAE